MRLRALLPFAAALLTALAIAAVAVARAPVQLEDPDDVNGPLDVRSVGLDDTVGPSWTIAIERPWNPQRTWDRAFVFIYLDTIGERRADYYVVVRSTGLELTGALWRDPRRGDDVKVRPLAVLRSSSRETQVAVPLSAMEFGPYRSVYRWWVVTTFSGEVCRWTCIDRVPDMGPIEQLLPGASPTPTPTTTPTATITPTPTPSS